MCRQFTVYYCDVLLKLVKTSLYQGVILSSYCSFESHETPSNQSLKTLYSYKSLFEAIPANVTKSIV